VSESDAETTPGRRRRFGTAHILLGLTLVVFLAMVGWRLHQTKQTQPVSGEKAPVFELQFFSGYELDEKQTVSLDDMRGNIVVLNFWASWCVQCRDETALFEQAWRRHQDDGVIFLGVAYVDVEPKSLAYMKEFDVTFPNAPDLRSAISDAYRITGVPETFIIDRDGTIVFTKEGPVYEAELNRVLTDLLAES
jgi:cytochrome c biogenesis protein CcmG/thiol:disulfide interchange protein DsbE